MADQEVLKMKCLHITISGVVQGVFFRSNIEELAKRLGLSGWVKNTDDNKVEIIAQGEEDSLEQLIQYCRTGPSIARVDDVVIEEKEIDEKLTAFEII